MISRTAPTNIVPQGSRLWIKPIQDKLCHLLYNQPYQDTALCIYLFPMPPQPTYPTYQHNEPCPRRTIHFSTHTNEIITLWLIAIPLQIPDKQTFKHT